MEEIQWRRMEAFVAGCSLLVVNMYNIFRRRRLFPRLTIKNNYEFDRLNLVFLLLMFIQRHAFLPEFYWSMMRSIFSNC